MRGINDINLRSIEGMSLAQVIDWVANKGYSTEALSNEEIYDLANAILDGHADEPDEPEELSFSDG